MRLFRKPRAPTPAPVPLFDHPGIRLRISVPSGVVVDADSHQLYYSAKYGNAGEFCGPACPPGCDEHGWLDLIAGGGVGTTEFSTVPVKIELKPVRLIEDPNDLRCLADSPVHPHFQAPAGLLLVRPA